VFDEVLGLPAHPLLVHAAVVFVPLFVAAAVVYVLVPFTRRWITWAVVGLAVVTPFAAWFTTLSGNTFRNKLISQGLAQEVLVKIDEHRSFGDRTLWAVLALAVVTVAVVLVQQFWAAGTGPGKLVVTIVLSVVVLALSGVSLYYVFKTGDSGSRIVWGS